jgi:MerR family transcriptional regulator, light-induced transcriptional regulator
MVVNFEAEQLAETMLTGDFDSSWNHIRKQQAAQKNSLFMYDRLLTEAMRYIGELWEHNAISVADEHLASALCDRMLSQYAGMRTAEPSLRKKAMLLCMEGEQHYLGLKMVASYFQECGWDTRFYGPNLPLEYALSSAMNWKPEVIALSVTMVYPLPKLTEYIRTFEQLQHKPTVMVGGRLLSKYDLRPHGSSRTVYLSDMYELQRWMTEAAEQQNKSKRSLG